MFVSLIGTWIQATAQSWLVFELTHSSFLLGVVGFLSAVPVFFLSLFGGAAADRINKKRILLYTQNAFMMLAVALGLLTQFRLVSPWQIMLIAVLNGIVMAFDAPSRQAVVVELVGKANLMNAIALNSAAFNSSRVIGPALAGVLIAVIGMSGCFYLNAASFLAVIIALSAIKLHDGNRSQAKGRIWQDIRQGLGFIRRDRAILLLMTMVGVTSVFGISYNILMPVIASDVLGVGARGLGMLMSCAGAGALIAALLLAKMGDYTRKGRFLVFSSLVFSLSLIGLGLSRSYPLSLAALALIGWSSVTSISLVNASLQQIVPDEFRGRLMSVFMCTFAGFVPFGNLLAGAVAEAWGASLAVTLGGFLCTVFFVFINLLYPDVKAIQ